MEDVNYVIIIGRLTRDAEYEIYQHRISSKQFFLSS